MSEKCCFLHDANMRSNERIVALLMKHGMQGYGVFWGIMERLANTRDYTHTADYSVIGYALRCDSGLVKSVVEDFGLFTFTEDCQRFFSESLTAQMNGQ